MSQEVDTPYFSDAVPTETTDESFADLFEQSIPDVKPGAVVVGTVLRADPENVLVDIGFKSEGQVPTWQFADAKGIANIEPGQKVEVMVEDVENDEGIVMLSKEKADRVRIWLNLAQAYESDEPVEGVITGRVKGGLQVNLLGVNGFLPGH